MFKKSFIFPEFEEFLNSVDNVSDKIVVISIIGKSSFKSNLKLITLGRMFEPHNTLESTNELIIQGAYDEENEVLFLHAHSLLDTDCLMKYLEDLNAKCNSTNSKPPDFLTLYNTIKNNFAKTMFLLFYISHIVILSHPGTTFDLNYFQYFKAIDQLRQKLSTQIIDLLQEIGGVSEEWVTNGRACTPRLLFYFESCPSNVENLKKLEHDIEDRIYHILRKIRIISNTNTASLFAIPLNEEFVYISTNTPGDYLGYSVRELIRGLTLNQQDRIQIKVPFCSDSTADRNFKSFLQVHINQALGKGFYDNVTSSRHSQQQPAHFELPSIKCWIETSKALYEMITKLEPIMSLHTDTRFSEQRCLKVLPLAVARYQEGLPSHYTKAIHENGLASALTFFGAQARGPLFQQYRTQLVNDCQSHWENGRQLCEVASLTGNPCTLPKHSSDQDHCSGIRYVAACDCGRRQGSREDPYSAKQANYIFYQQQCKECVCGNLERINFLTFQPSIKEYTAATLTDMEEPLSVLSDRSELTPEHIDHTMVRQPSTTEYLPGMLTLTSPPGLLPHYSSWSLVCLGPSSLYSHNLGLSESHHPGFLNSTNYLLPWDVTVYSSSKNLWPAINKNSSRGRRPRISNNSALPQFTVKVFIGVEYECSRGHRFMMSSPDKVLRATPGSIVKDTGHKIAESDMPLYFPCPCRTTKPLTAQLMRLHVVTPKAPVHCTLNPRVQPASGAPVFVNTQEGPTALTQSAYWIMRLPYVYVSDKENYPENYSAKLLAKVFGVSEIE